MKNADRILDTRRELYQSYGNEYEKIFFDDDTGGYVVKHIGHKLDPETGKFEMKSAHILAHKGYAIEMMDESDFTKPQYDIKVDGVPSEVKVMSGFRNIHRRAEQASKQGAKRIIYYINFENDREMLNRFNNVYKTIGPINEIWYIKNEKLHFHLKI
ncbi:MAG: hypothetical protein FWH23_05765 [Bacteroidales bacterium]|nr:hypothetical protein [Bacteroidales bacterium]